MTARLPSPPRRPGPLRRLRRDERGASLVEYAVSVALFLMLFFALLDFGRLLYNWVMAEKAMQMAARIAIVRPAVCPGVPQTNARGSGSTALDRFGAACNDAANMCAGEALAPIACAGTTVSPTAEEIWTRVHDLLPPNATRANLRFSYGFDPRMNFLGGPYVPVVTVELQNLGFEFVSPLFGLARATGAVVTGPDTPNDIPFPSMSVSLPGEDLALGMDG